MYASRVHTEAEFRIVISRDRRREREKKEIALSRVGRESRITQGGYNGISARVFFFFFFFGGVVKAEGLRCLAIFFFF